MGDVELIWEQVLSAAEANELEYLGDARRVGRGNSLE